MCVSLPPIHRDYINRYKSISALYLLTDDLHVRRLDECEEGGVSHHLAAVAPGVVEVDVPQEQCLPVRQQALQPVTILFMLITAFDLIFICSFI